MDAIQFKSPGSWTQVLEWAQRKDITPGNNEVKVKLMARPVNPSDQMFIEGVYRKKPVFPQIAGLEGVGIIEQCGSNVNPTLIGKHVCFRAVGTWADYINVKVEDCRIIPDEIPFAIACQLSLNTLTSYALLDQVNLSKGNWLLLTAASSSLCRQVIQIATNKGINVIAIVRKDEQKEKLYSLGAKLVINSETEDVVDGVQKLVPQGVNACLDAVGGTLGSKLFKIAAPDSVIVLYGRLSKEPVQFFNGEIIYKNLKLLGFGLDKWLESKTKDQLDIIWEEMISTIIQGKLKLNFDNSYKLSEFNKAINEYLSTGSKIILHS